MKCGSVILPFDHTIAKESKLYQLYNTNLHEKLEQEKKAVDKTGLPVVE